MWYNEQPETVSNEQHEQTVNVAQDEEFDQIITYGIL
jgi:hypothetical protein